MEFADRRIGALGTTDGHRVALAHHAFAVFGFGARKLTGTKAKNSEGVMGEGYTMTIGGSQSANPTVGELHRKAIPADEIKAALKEVLIEKFGATPKA